MTQLTIQDAIDAGHEAAQHCADKAQTLGFSTEAARVFVIRWLAEYGNTAGEDLVEAARKTGKPELIPHDGRAWGAVFLTLQRQHRIRCLRADLPRKRGNGTSGGRLWGIVQ
jgi:hypothetical protein